MPVPLARYDVALHGASVSAEGLPDPPDPVERALRLVSARRAFPRAQLLLASEVRERLSVAASVGWYPSAVAEPGSFAVARRDGPYAPYVGEVLLLLVGDRSVFVLLRGLVDLDADLSVARRVFFDLDLLARPTVTATISLCR